MLYCTYLTIYRGNELPSFYIGSSFIEKIEKGYRGSVQSKKYKSIWCKELRENPHLFKTIIVSTHVTREEALEKELKFQTALDVVKSSMYINQGAYPHSFFRDNRGKKNPMFGVKHSEEVRRKISDAGRRPCSEETRRKIGEANRIALKGNVPANKTKIPDNFLSNAHLPRHQLEKIYNVGRSTLTRWRVVVGYNWHKAIIPCT